MRPTNKPPLHNACRKGNLREAEKSLAAGTDVNTPDAASFGWSALHYAVENSYTEIVRLLL